MRPLALQTEEAEFGLLRVGNPLGRVWTRASISRSPLPGLTSPCCILLGLGVGVGLWGPKTDCLAARCSARGHGIWQAEGWGHISHLHPDFRPQLHLFSPCHFVPYDELWQVHIVMLTPVKITV